MDATEFVTFFEVDEEDVFDLILKHLAMVLGIFFVFQAPQTKVKIDIIH